MQPNQIAIQVQHLGKKYTIGGPQERNLTFREAIVNSVKAPFKRLTAHKPSQEFWALKDISFDIEKGEVVGIIGRNGAGKSTLLKILSRITSPTEGTVDLYGRVGSLLEVGTGFHSELTGRENIFLSGSILGMKNREIEAKLEDIVKFSEIEKFLDTPVKRYSSGMYVRLAFAVAANMDTEILLVDEVLAVGDAQFQKKCLGKMGDVATKEGRTVVFVSHNMAAVQQLCSRAILIDKGLIFTQGSVEHVINNYISNHINLKSDSTHGFFDFSNRINAHNNGRPIIKRVILLDRKFKKRQSFLTGECLRVGIFVEGLSQINGAELGVAFNSDFEQRITNSSSWMVNKIVHKPRKNQEWVLLTIPKILFTPGKWGINVNSTIHSTGTWLDRIDNQIFFTVEGADFFNTGQLITKEYGFIILPSEWEINLDYQDCKTLESYEP